MIRALVYKNGRQAATLTRDGNQVTFRYLEPYLAGGGRPVATSLPLTPEPLTLPNGATPAFFSGLLPEGRRLAAIASRVKSSLDDDLLLLLELGQDLIGDVQVLPEGVSPDSDPEQLILDLDDPDLDFQKLRNQVLGSRASGIPGFQDKVSSKMINLPAKQRDQDFILKLNPAEAPFAVENENYFLALAKTVGLESAKARLIHDPKGNSALLITRFDRVLESGKKSKLGAEDGTQVMNKYPLEKYEIDFVDLAGALIAKTSAKALAASKLFAQLSYSYLIGNGDAHAKNFSILQQPTGEWFISPAYDLLNTRYYNDREMALPLLGTKTNWDRALFLELARKIGLPEKVAVNTLDNQLTKLAGLPGELLDRALPFRKDQNAETSSFLKKRFSKLAS